MTYVMCASVLVSHPILRQEIECMLVLKRITARPKSTIRSNVYNLASEQSRNKWGKYLIVYKYTCICGAYYIGQTKRALRTRASEHERTIKNRNRQATS